VEPYATPALAIPGVGPQVDLEEIIPRNPGDGGKPEFRKTETNNTGPSTALEQVKFEVVGKGFRQLLGINGPVQEKQVLPALRHEVPEEWMNHENSIGWEDFRKFLPPVVENPFQGTPDKKAMGQTAERSQGYFVPDFVGHARSLIDLLKTVGMNPGLVGTDPLLVYEGKAFLHILDFGQPRGMPKEGNLNPVFQEKSCIGLWGRITDQLEGHVGGRDLP